MVFIHSFFLFFSLQIQEELKKIVLMPTAEIRYRSVYQERQDQARADCAARTLLGRGLLDDSGPLEATKSRGCWTPTPDKN